MKSFRDIRNRGPQEGLNESNQYAGFGGMARMGPPDAPDNALDGSDVGWSVNDLTKPEMLQRVNTFLAAINDRLYANPSLALNTLQYKMQQIGLVFTMPHSSYGWASGASLKIPITRFGGMWGQDPKTGRMRNDSGFQDNTEFCLKIDIEPEDGMFNIHAQIVEKLVDDDMDYDMDYDDVDDVDDDMADDEYGGYDDGLDPEDEFDGEDVFGEDYESVLEDITSQIAENIGDMSGANDMRFFIENEMTSRYPDIIKNLDLPVYTFRIMTEEAIEVLAENHPEQFKALFESSLDEYREMSNYDTTANTICESFNDMEGSDRPFDSAYIMNEASYFEMEKVMMFMDDDKTFYKNYYLPVLTSIVNKMASKKRLRMKHITKEFYDLVKRASKIIGVRLKRKQIKMVASEMAERTIIGARHGEFDDLISRNGSLKNINIR